MNSYQTKLQRISTGNKPRVLDLFAGCGGISLGFHAAGFKLLGAVEFDKAAIRSHAMNFHSDCSPELFESHATPRDITKVEPDQLLRELGILGPVDQQVDVIVGGPPCQAFARVGRAKLREIAEHPDAFLKDPRSNLYLRYLDYVKAYQPLAILMENVPDILNFGGHNVAEEICELLSNWGYRTHYTMLNAVYYGVPEMRERMFLIAYREEVGPMSWFPEPTHWIDLPQGYHSSRQVALKTIKTGLFNGESFYLEPPESHAELAPAITAKQALSDLPKFSDDSEQKQKKSPRRFDTLTPYPRRKELNNYQSLMRNWPGFSAGNGIVDHAIRYLPRDYKIFRRMKPGDQYPEAHQLALRMFEERLQQIEQAEGKRPKKNSKRYQGELAIFVPPYDPGKFPNKWRKMEPNRPARTLMAHLGKDSYSHIHYDSKQARTISVREAARLQSFPDGFRFQGPMNPAFKQIGNAVPPLMARNVAQKIFEQLSRAESHEKKNSGKKTISV
ncbi:MAG: DNA cytosine methyltransferase [Candidatus Sedimenticola sp. (ex Thyasira tokunagai)]